MSGKALTLCMLLLVLIQASCNCTINSVVSDARNASDKNDNKVRNAKDEEMRTLQLLINRKDNISERTIYSAKTNSGISAKVYPITLDSTKYFLVSYEYPIAREGYLTSDIVLSAKDSNSSLTGKPDHYYFGFGGHGVLTSYCYFDNVKDISSYTMQIKNDMFVFY